MSLFYLLIKLEIEEVVLYVFKGLALHIAFKDSQLVQHLYIERLSLEPFPVGLVVNTSSAFFTTCFRKHPPAKREGAANHRELRVKRLMRHSDVGHLK